VDGHAFIGDGEFLEDDLDFGWVGGWTSAEELDWEHIG
jgi:hypothetical protein